jgi:hypothetical protein
MKCWLMYYIHRAKVSSLTLVCMNRGSFIRWESAMILCYPPHVINLSIALKSLSGCSLQSERATPWTTNCTCIFHMFTSASHWKVFLDVHCNLKGRPLGLQIVHAYFICSEYFVHIMFQKVSMCSSKGRQLYYLYNFSIKIYVVILF